MHIDTTELQRIHYLIMLFLRKRYFAIAAGRYISTTADYRLPDLLKQSHTQPRVPINCCQAAILEASMSNT